MGREVRFDGMCTTGVINVVMYMLNYLQITLRNDSSMNYELTKFFLKN